jgi:hypothetical protein
MKVFLSNELVNRYATLFLLPTLQGFIVLVAACSLIKWYESAMFFFFSGVSGVVAHIIAASLSPIVLLGVETLIPNERNIYLIVIASSTASFIKFISAPYVAVCRVLWCLDFHIIGVPPTNTTIPHIDLPVTLSCPWSLLK